jgi:predicted anti-sigma-YlaC factor YlaD
MACEQWREAISAIADDEPPGLDERLVDAHVARCPACRAFRDGIEQIRPTRLRAAGSMPDLSSRIVEIQAFALRAGRWRVIRGLLAAIAAVIVVLSAPALVLGQEHATSAHAARHIGAFAAAYGAGLLFVAIRPGRARTMLPVAATIALALLITGLVDIGEGRVPLWGESRHLLEIVSVVLVWLLAAPAIRRGPATGRAQTDVRLQVVDDLPDNPDASPGSQAI